MYNSHVLIKSIKLSNIWLQAINYHLVHINVYSKAFNFKLLQHLIIIQAGPSEARQYFTVAVHVTEWCQ